MLVEEIQKKVCDKEWSESIPDCPKPLEKVINDCRAFDPFVRPSAGGESVTVITPLSCQNPDPKVFIVPGTTYSTCKIITLFFLLYSAGGQTAGRGGRVGKAINLVTSIQHFGEKEPLL